MPKKRFVLAAVVVMIAIVGLYIFLTGNDRKGACNAADIYIKAVINRNFDVIYDLNSITQKRKLFIFKESGLKKDELLKEAYNEQKASFDSAQPLPDMNAVWIEKFIFIPDMKYRIVKTAAELNTDNPTAFYIKRIDMVVEVEMEYLNRDTAPLYEGRRIKRAGYFINMVHSKNITRTVRDITVDDKWLFKGIAIKKGSVAYWD